MNAPMLKLFLMIFALLVFSGCTRTVTVYKPVEVLVPVDVPCAVPAPVCDSSKTTDTELITEARLCIRRYREAFNACTE